MALRKHAAELLTAAAILIGWCLLTYAIDQRSIWAGSIGLLLLLCAGIRFLGMIFWQGLYALTRDDTQEKTNA